MMILGNKCDLPDSQRKVLFEETKKEFEPQEILCFETSAKTGVGVEHAFQEISKKLIATT